jgi:hypothetical protein
MNFDLHISGTISPDRLAAVVALLEGTATLPPPAPPIALPDKAIWTSAHWLYQDISALPVDPMSAWMIQRSGVRTDAEDGRLRPVQPDFGAPWGTFTRFGMPINLVNSATPKVPVTFTYAGESDPGPYPIPANPSVEQPQDGDKHLLLLDVDAWKLYEIAYYTFDGTTHRGSSGAIWDLANWVERPRGWTSADAAGLPIYPLLVKPDDVFVKKSIDHAIRVTCPRTRRGFVSPARHFASQLTSTDYLPMGARLRLKAAYDITPFPPEVQVILRALKKYGMILADNGLGWFFQGIPDPRYNNDSLGMIKKVKGSDLEVIQLPAVTTSV